jgi:hypothetical protein
MFPGTICHETLIAGDDGGSIFSLKPGAGVIDMLIAMFLDSRSAGCLVLCLESGSTGHEKKGHLTFRDSDAHSGKKSL